MNILMIILAFNFILIIHELGHFTVAKLSKIKVQEFSLFVGPKLFSFTKGETMYSLRCFPILAYVKMEGEDEESDSENAFNKKPVWVRAAVIAAGPLANIVSAIILVAIVFSFNGYTTLKVSEIEPDSPAAVAGLLEGDRIVKYDNKRTYTDTDITQFMVISKGKPVELEVEREGKRVELYFEPLVVPASKRYMLGFTGTTDSNLVEAVTQGGVAEQAGIQKGDKIIKIDDTDVINIDQIREALQKSGGSAVDISVDRNGTVMQFEATPVESEVAEEYSVGFALTRENGNVFDSLKQGVIFAYSNVRTVAYTLIWLVTGKVSFAQMLGPVGIVSTMNDAVKVTTTMYQAILTILYLTAYISVAIGATNLIPFPALDGSKLVILGVEAIRRKPIPVEKEAIITTIGFFVLIGFSIFVMFKDIVRIIT